MQRLTREQILAVQPRTAEVDVPEWGGTVLVQELTVAQQEAIDKPRSNVDTGLKLFLEGVIEPHFEPSDYDALKLRGTKPMERVLTAILELSGMTKEAAEKLQKK